MTGRPPEQTGDSRGPRGPEWSLEGRVAIVTGSSAGIGRATAFELAAWGATVVVNSRSAERARPVVEAIAAEGGSAVAVAADLERPDAAAELVDRAVAECGRVDVLVNNAGHGMIAASEDVELDEWQRGLDVMLTAPFLCAQEAGRHMLAQGRGVIVNVTSICAHAALPRRAVYTTAKHGLLGLTRTLATEWADRGVRVVSVDPAYIATDFVKGTMRTGGFDAGVIERRTPLGRLGEPAEVARMIAFLASDAASYSTGNATIVDGGWLAHGGW